MIQALLLSIGQLGDRRILAVLAKSIAITLLVFAAIGYSLVRAFGWLAALPQVAQWLGGEADTVGVIGGVVAVLLLGWMLFRAIAVAVIGLFADEIVEAVERRHYPARATIARSPGWRRSARMALASVGRALGYNVLASPFYVLLLFTAIGPLLLFMVVNAVALGRDLGEMVAARHLPAERMPQWLATTRGSRAATGLVATALFMLPVVNLLAPILGAAFATHRYRGIQE